MINAAPAGDAVPLADRAPRLAVVRNPHSTRNRRAAQPLAAEGEAAPGVPVASPATVAEMREALAGFARAGIDHLAVDGGDGTLREVMSLLPEVWGARLPTLALLTGGNANLTAVDVGSAGHGPEALAALQAALAAGRGQRLRRRPIRIQWPDQTRPPRLAFFVGCAGFHRGWKLATVDVHAAGLMHGPAVAAAVIGAAWQTLFGGAASPWRRGEPLEIAIDDAPARGGQRFLFVATALHRLYGKTWPFWDHGDATIRWTDIDAPPPRFGRSLRGLLRGQPSAAMRATGAYRSGGAERIRLKLAGPLVCDGEAHAPGADGWVELSAGPELEFFSP